MIKELLYCYVKQRHRLTLITIWTALIAITTSLIINAVLHKTIIEVDSIAAFLSPYLFYAGVLILMVTRLPIIIKCDSRADSALLSLVVWYISITALLLVAYLLGMFPNILWLIGVDMIIFSSILIELIGKSTKYKGCNLVKSNHLITLYSVASVLILLSIPIAIHTIFDNINSIYITDIAPVLALSMAFVNMLVGYNIVHSYCRGSHHIKEIAISLLIIIPIVWHYNIEMSIITLLLAITTLVSVRKPNIFSNLTIFYVVFILISLILALKMSRLNTIYIFDYPFLLSDSNEPLGLYAAIADRSADMKITAPQKIKFCNLLTIFCYTSLISIGIGLLLLRKRLFDLNIGGVTARDRVWKTVSISLYGAIIAIILIGRGFSKEINQETQIICITEMSKTMAVDYRYKNCPLNEWIDQKKMAHQIDLDLYNRDGALLPTNSRNYLTVDLQPAKLPDIVLNKLSKNLVVINKELYNGIEEYLSAYMILEDNLIMRMPLNPRFIITKYTPLITKAINISVVSLLLIIIYFTLGYNRQIKPFKFLKNNRKRIVLHKKIAIPLSMRSNYELNYLLHEYNSMVNELSHWHSLQMVVERQILYDRTMRMVAHEIKNPLTPMLMMSQLSLQLLKNGDPKALETVEKSLHTIIQQTKRINELIAKMMNNKDSVRISSEVGNVSEVIQDVIKFYSLNTHITFKTEGVGEELYTNASERDLWSVISNIVINGIDAISQSDKNDGELSINLSYDETFIFVTIRNNGIPIDPDSVDKLFDYNFTTKPNGNGLGLFVSNQLVKYAGGSVQLNCSDQNYTEFEITLPYSKKFV